MHAGGARQERPPEPRLLVIETSHRRGLVAIARGQLLLGERRLDEARRHARDLVPSVRDLLRGQGWAPRELDAVIVSRGPGSYTGLRVGLMSAKTLAYATGCALFAVDTFAAVARQAPPDVTLLDVIADAQQDRLYVQRYTEAGAGPLHIEPFAEWNASLPAGMWVTGPGLEAFGVRLAAHVQTAPADAWFPQAASLVAIGLDRWLRGESDDPFETNPLYLRPSSAEEKWRGR
jgi:tRNA threonylcarbamoyladenosine biosynthesis protein TsaB